MDLQKFPSDLFNVIISSLDLDSLCKVKRICHWVSNNSLVNKRLEYLQKKKISSKYINKNINSKSFSPTISLTVFPSRNQTYFIIEDWPQNEENISEMFPKIKFIRKGLNTSKGTIVYSAIISFQQAKRIYIDFLHRDNYISC